MSNFSFRFDEFKTKVSGFITAIVQEVMYEYEFIKAGEHKSHLLLNYLDLDAFGAETNSNKAKEWNKKNNCTYTVYTIDLHE